VTALAFFGPVQMAFLDRSVELIGPIFQDSYGHGRTTYAVGWNDHDLKIGKIIPDREAGFRIDRHGTPIGWDPASSLAFIGGPLTMNNVH
jgi:hypothetical protein